MAQLTDTQLQTQIEQVRNETVAGANSKSRIATLLTNLNDSKALKTEIPVPYDDTALASRVTTLENATPVASGTSTRSISGTAEIIATDAGKILEHTGVGTITKAADVPAGSRIVIIKQDGGIATIGFATKQFGINTGTKLDEYNPAVELIFNADNTVTRIGELSV